MNKYFPLIVLIIVILVVIFAQRPAVEENGNDSIVPEETPVVQEPEAPVVVEEPPVVDVVEQPKMDKKVAELLAKGKGMKQENYLYFYTPPESGATPDQYYVLNTKVRVTKFDDNFKKGEDFINTVYLDRSKESAVGYCLRWSDYEPYCPQGKGPFSLSYEELMTPTPADWLKKINYAELIGYESEKGRSITIVRTTIDGEDAIVWLDSFYGYPLEVVFNPDGLERDKRVHKYTELRVGDVKLEQVTAPTN